MLKQLKDDRWARTRKNTSWFQQCDRNWNSDPQHRNLYQSVAKGILRKTVAKGSLSVRCLCIWKLVKHAAFREQHMAARKAEVSRLTALPAWQRTGTNGDRSRQNDSILHFQVDSISGRFVGLFSGTDAMGSTDIVLNAPKKACLYFDSVRL